MARIVVSNRTLVKSRVVVSDRTPVKKITVGTPVKSVRSSVPPLGLEGDLAAFHSLDPASERLKILGGEGVDVTLSDNEFTVSGEDASTSNKGIAQFNSEQFNVSSGAVSIGTIEGGSIDSSNVTIKLRFSNVADSAPSISGIEAGELILNNNDGKLYYYASDASVKAFIDSGNVQALIDNLPNAITTDDIAEGFTNLYYTSARADADFKVSIQNIDRDIIPDSNEAYDLGSLSNKFRDLYLSGSSIFLGDLTLKDSAGKFVVLDSQGDIISISISSTDDVPEGSNLYYTDERVRAAISVTDAGGDGSLTYDSAVGEITYTGPSAADIRAHFSGLSGVTFNSSTGEISIGQPVGPSDNVAFNDVTVNGDLIVSGTTTTLNTTELEIEDINITLASTATSSVAAGGAGFTIGGANATFTYSHADSQFQSSISFSAPELVGVYAGFDSDFTQKTTDNLTEGSTNLYYTRTRFDSALGDPTSTSTIRGYFSGSAGLNYNSSTGVFSVASTGVTAGIFGSASAVPVITVDSTGLIDSIGTLEISALTVQDEGTPLSTAATVLNFVGNAVTASGTGATKTITISQSEGGTDSATVSAIIEADVDSAYVNARADIPTFGTDFVDSATVSAIIEAEVDSAYIAARIGGPFIDSAYFDANIPTFGTDFVDSATVSAIILSDVDSSYIKLRTGGPFIDSAYFNANIPTFGTDFVDSAAVSAIILSDVDSAYINARADIPTFGTDFVDSAFVTSQIVSSLTWDSSLGNLTVQTGAGTTYTAPIRGFNDNVSLAFGNDDDATINRNPTNLVIKDSTGGIYVEAQDIYLSSKNNGNPIWLHAGANDGVKINDSSGDLRIQTVSTGAKVYGSLTVGATYIASGDLETDSADIHKISGSVANYGSFVGDSATISQMTADSAHIGIIDNNTLRTNSLNADSADIHFISGSVANYGSLVSDSAVISQLSTDSASIGQLSVDSARIDVIDNNTLRTNSLDADSAIITNISGTDLNYGAGRISQLTSDSAGITTIRVSDSATVGQVNFRTGWADSHIGFVEGALWYDPHHKNLNYYTDIDHPIEIGMQIVERVYNNTGSEIAKGSPLYYSGNYTNDAGQESPTVALADATSASAYNVQGLASEPIANGSYGFIVVAGVIDGFDTSSLNAGENFFVGLTPGALQNSAPAYPNFPMCLGWVIKSDATDGKVIINQQNHSVSGFRVQSAAHIGGNLTIDGDLNVAGTQTITSTANVEIGGNIQYLNAGDTIGEAGTTFVGTGLDDAFYAGHYSGDSSTKSFFVKIDATGTPDTFEWGFDSTVGTEATGIAITGSAQILDSEYGIEIDFGATTGHTLGDKWTGTATSTNVDTGIFSNRHTGTDYTHVGLFFDVSENKWTFLNDYEPEPEAPINLGAAGTVLGTVKAATFEGDLTGDVTGNADTATTLATGRTIDVTGDVIATGVSFNGSQDITLTTVFDSTATPSLSRLTLTQTTGTAPMTISSSTLVSNLNADRLDNQHGSYYRINVYDASGTLLN